MNTRPHTIPDISIILPIFNEEAVFPELMKRLTASLSKMRTSYEILFIDDFSQDTTRHLIQAETKKNPHVKALFFSRNFGHQAAVSAGLEQSTGACVVIMDSDLQDPPELLPEMYARLSQGYDVVYGIRQKRKEGVIKRLCYSLYYRILTSGKERYVMPRDAGDFCLMSRRAVHHINNFKERGRYVRGLRAWIGLNQIGIPYERDARYAGVSKYSALRLIGLAYDGLFSFTNIPLVLVNVSGILFFLLSLVGICVYLILRISGIGYVPGFATTIILILFIGGIQLLMLGIVGEYLKRIYEETKQRPLYIVDKKINIDAE